MKTFRKLILYIIIIILQVGCSNVPIETISKDNLINHLEVFTSSDFEGNLWALRVIKRL